MQDLHIHTILSDGICTVDEIMEKASIQDIELGISDHILCKKMISKESVIKYFDYLSNFPVLKGGEIDLGETGIIDDSIMSKADYIIGSIHSVDLGDSVIRLGKYFDWRDHKQILKDDFIFDDYICCKALDKILNTINHELSQNSITILGHCTVNPFYEQVNSRYRYDWENEVISICKTHNTAIEISGLWVEPSVDFICKAINNGVKLTFGSDCHTRYSSKYRDYYNYVERKANITEGDVLKIVRC